MNDKVKKKVLVVTLPLGRNYGGILQAYALQRVIGRIGLDVSTAYPKLSWLNWILGSIKDVIIRLRGGHREGRQTASVESYITQHTRSFMNNYMRTSIMSGYSLKRNRSFGEEFDGFVAGSDQVWRGSRALAFYMLGFSQDLKKIRISYSASFGIENPVFSKKIVKQTKKCIDRMNEVSVREESGVRLMNTHWGASALQHVDPTLLVDARYYSDIIDESNAQKNKNSLFVYVLDRSDSNNDIVRLVEKETGNLEFELLPKEYISLRQFKKNKDAYVMPPVEQWLRSFRDADYIVTDSFHGTVFSIIFNKPFIAIGNKGRGLARFTSLLKIFGLEDRLVTSIDEVTEELINKEINWTSVNAKIKSEQKRSFDYLKKHLG